MGSINGGNCNNNIATSTTMTENKTKSQAKYKNTHTEKRKKTRTNMDIFQSETKTDFLFIEAIHFVRMVEAAVAATLAYAVFFILDWGRIKSEYVFISLWPRIHSRCHLTFSTHSPTHCLHLNLWYAIRHRKLSILSLHFSPQWTHFSVLWTRFTTILLFQPQ